MAAGAEDQPRVQPQGEPAVLRHSLPFGDHHQLFPHLNGLVIFPPVVFPVAVSYIGYPDVLIGRADAVQNVPALFIVGQIAFYPADALELVLQLLVHIVPVLVVVLKKIPEVRLVLDHEAPRPHGGHGLAAFVDPILRRVDTDFNPAHIVSLLCWWSYCNSRRRTCQRNYFKLNS